jgi:hypothetical protein
LAAIIDQTMICPAANDCKIWPVLSVLGGFLKEMNSFGVAIFPIGRLALEKQMESKSVGRKNEAIGYASDSTPDSLENQPEKSHGVASA